jgi:hypothetical protein
MLTESERATIARHRRVFERAQTARPPVLLHADIKPAHLLHDPVSGALTGLLDWGDASLGHGDFDLAIVGAFCGSQVLHSLLERLDHVERERVSASIPFLLSVRWLQDARDVKNRGGEPGRVERCLQRLREHLRDNA